jgi:hypothetical protein
MVEVNMGDKPKGRPAKPYPKIPDTYENIVKALVKPVKKDKRGSHTP